MHCISPQQITFEKLQLKADQTTQKDEKPGTLSQSAGIFLIKLNFYRNRIGENIEHRRSFDHMVQEIIKIFW